MNFYYDPILGLRYSVPYPEEGPILIVDISKVPPDFDIAEFTRKWEKYTIKNPLTLHSSSQKEEWMSVITLEPVITSNHLSFVGGGEKVGKGSVGDAVAGDYGME